MKHITFHFDFISPYAYLAFEKLPEALKGLTWRVDLRPLLFAGLLKHHGQLGPAEIAPKREWTYRQVAWLAHAHGVPMELPAAHPFNPLGVLRLALACGAEGLVNRHVAEAVFRHVWRGGAEADHAQRLHELKALLQPHRDPDSAEVKGELRANTEAAVARGLFGVPTFEVEGRLFWGFDALPMLRAFLEGDAWFDGPGWHAAGTVPGKQRPR